MKNWSNALNASTTTQHEEPTWRPGLARIWQLSAQSMSKNMIVLRFKGEKKGEIKGILLGDQNKKLGHERREKIHSLGDPFLHFLPHLLFPFCISKPLIVMKG